MAKEHTGLSPLGTVEGDTIVAISTSMAQAGIGIVRLSGPQAFSLADQIFHTPSGRPYSDQDQRKMRYGHIMDGAQELDEVLCVYMKAPHTYTVEDVVEIDCHGGSVSVRKVLALLLKKGARLADPGEFTKRAFLNGRLDLAQAEAVEDIITAKTNLAQQNALGQLRGGLSLPLQAIKDQLLSLLAQVEYSINFMEDAQEELPRTPLIDQADQVIEQITGLLEGAETGRLLREGIRTVIVGRPNVGKSSLLNALLREERAIVTDIPGTTRDAIEESYQVKGLPLRLVDTAGIRKTADPVESLGVGRSMALLKEADLVLLLIDGTQPLLSEDLDLLAQTKDQVRILLLNKADQGLQEKTREAVRLADSSSPGSPMLALSAKTGQGLSDLEKTIHTLFFGAEEHHQSESLLSNLRQIDLLEKAQQALEEARKALRAGVSLDALDVDLQFAYQKLAEITGEAIEEDVLNKIFQNFCVGK